MSRMFYCCSELKTITVDSFNIDKTIYNGELFYNCISLIGEKGTVYDPDNTGKEYARIDAGPSAPGYFTSKEAEFTDDLQITRFINPSGKNTKRVEDGIPTYSFTVDNGVTEIKIDLEVTEGAEWELYNDESCSILMGKDYSHTLSPRDNKWYIYITKDGKEKVYCLNIYRDPFVVYKPFIIDKDGFGFINNQSSIFGTYPFYYEYTIPFNSFKKVLGETRAKQIYDDKSKFEGFCYGFTQLANLFYLNPSLFVELYPEKSSVYEVKPGDHVKNLKDENNQESFDTKKLLELAWTYQFLLPVEKMQYKKVNDDGDGDVSIDNCYAQGTNCLNEIIHHLEAGEKIALVVRDKNSKNESTAHSIYAFGYSETSDGYDIYIYDCNHPGKMQVLKVYRENSGELSWRYNDTFGTKGDGYGFIYFDGIEISEEDFRGFTSSANGEWYKGKNESTDWYLYKTNNKELKMIRIGDGSPLKKEDMIPVTVLYAGDNSSNSADGLYYIPEGEYEIQNDGQDGINISITSMDSGIWFESENIDNVVVDVEQDGSENEVIIKGNQGDRFKIRLTFDNDNVEYKEMILEGNLASSRAEAMNSGEEIRIKGANISSVEGIDLNEKSVKVNLLETSGNAPLAIKIEEKNGNSVIEITDGDKVIFNEKFDQNNDKNLYFVAFNSNGHGTAPDSQQISAGGKVSKPADLTASGYTFGGWYKESSCINQWNFGTDIVSSSMTLYAKWTSNGSSYSGNYSSGSSGGGGGSISKAKTTTGATYSPNWFVDASGVWKIRNSKGEIIKNAWLCDDVITANGQNVWYLLQADGSMLSAGLVQDNTGNFYSLETTHNGYFGMMRYKDGYYDCNGQQVYLKFNQKHDNSFGAVINEDGLEKLKQIYGITKYPIGNETCTYTSTF